jgi:DNA-directed RNA polymerase subunit M/transcription elongation factor TFIIS
MLAEKKWVVRDGKPRCRNCNSLLSPVDEPTALKCHSCGSMYPLSDEELAELTFDLSD